MTLVAFDAKQFRRGKTVATPKGSDLNEKYSGFNTHLGVGVSIDDPQSFVRHYLDANRDLMEDFKIHYSVPFFTSRHLRNTMGMSKAMSFADKLVSRVQEHISSVHCSFVILSPSKIPTVSVGGFKSGTTNVPIHHFINILGPMFSYLTAHSYLWMKDYRNVGDLELHMDSFRSKHAKAWAMMMDSVTPKVFTRGDECNPFISCADIIAFLTDAKLYSQRLRLNPTEIEKVWKKYAFGVTTRFFDQNSLHYYTWKNDDHVDLTPYLARPVIFLAIDHIETEGLAREEDEADTGDMPDKPRKFNRVIKNTPIYYAAVDYAFQKKGCLKLFDRREDMPLVRDGDIFVYVGLDAERIGKTLQHGYKIQVLSGLELRRLSEGKKSN